MYLLKCYLVLPNLLNHIKSSPCLYSILLLKILETVIFHFSLALIKFKIHLWRKNTAFCLKIVDNFSCEAFFSNSFQNSLIRAK